MLSILSVVRVFLINFLINLTKCIIIISNSYVYKPTDSFVTAVKITVITI